MGFLDGIGDALGINRGKATAKAADQNTQIIDHLDPVGRGYLDQARTNSLDLLDLGKRGAGVYADAMGLNGADGAGRATEAFQTGPGYTFTRDQGLDAVMRRNSALGRVQSGNTEADLTQYATGLADQTYGDWLSRLAPYNDMMVTGTQSDNMSLGNLADWASSISSAKMGAVNQKAGGKEAGQGWALPIASVVADFAGGSWGYGGGGKK